ncbi:winged helix-turn-helix domain-containing protein [Enterococcus sp. HY326]|uniref:winged helix-turn-helix domain-containing protein n=1 Tax=Enterococcus sp. HY326 TaxID=2971265 RepID=UPI00223FA98E|nr:helix-turn-helix domain-containing protein [Enterococcus sp. HY326]
MILTKNSLGENLLKAILEKLGYEVFCSEQVVHKLLQGEGKIYLSLFYNVIFSETLSNHEVHQLLELSKDRDVNFIRLDSESITDEMWRNWHSLGLKKWLSNDVSLSQLREELSDQNLSFSDLKKSSSTADKEKSKQAVKKLLNNLSPKEAGLFEILCRAQGEIILRVDVCEQLWKIGANHSTLTQLSQLIQRIRKKMEHFGVDGNLLETHWRSGYSLSQDFFEILPIDSQKKFIKAVS